MAWKWFGVVLGATIAGLLLIISTTSLFIQEGRASVIPPSVVTPMGRYEGKVKTLPDGSSTTRYAGIAFAQPPVGNLRFRRPEPIQVKPSPEKAINAQGIKKSCWSITSQITSKYHSEDCLYLNVYVPNRKQCQTMRYPVMVWIHGGGFVAGSVFPEPIKFVDRGEVMVVTFNYRLGVFGFLTTQDDALPENNGLWDQVLAMRWVKDNIEYFGGDSNSITVFGESAGAISTALHAISPVSSSLFNKVILQSGSASGFITKDPIQVAKEFGRQVGCSIIDDTACLRNASVEVLLNRSKMMAQARGGIDFLWMPTLDGDLIVDEPSKVFKNRTYLASINAFDRDYLFGLNNNEGSLIIQNFLNPLTPTSVENMHFFKNLVDKMLTMKYDIPQGNLQNISDAVVSFYTGSSTTDYVSKETVMDLVADSAFYAPGLDMAKAVSYCYQSQTPVCHSNNGQQTLPPECASATGKTFIYFFDFCPPSDECKPNCMTHGLDVSYEFPRQAFEDNVKQLVSDNFIDILSTFGKTSQPESVVNFEWPPFESSSQNYLRFSPYSSVCQYLHHYRMDLWMETIPKLIEQLTSVKNSKV